MKDNRRIYEKYERGEAHAALILKRKTSKISELLGSIEKNLLPFETIDVSEWAGERFYIVVNDERYGDYPESARVGFTVNIDDDSIIYSVSSEKYPSGGNCFVRGLRWKRFVNKNFGKSGFRWYEHTSIKRTERVTTVYSAD